jgi:competence ComEA-like helix-hairpin-helix protein
LSAIAAKMTLDRSAIGRLGLLCLTLLLTTCVRPLSAQEGLPDGKGKETLENTCTECHGLDKALNQLRTERQWRVIALRMRSKGATMSDDELQTLVGYLSQNFGAVEGESKSHTEGRDARINVNKASAKEIESMLQLRPAEAAAIVRYRQSKGPFRSWRDLGKVEGVGKSRIEAVKDRITF